MDARDRDSILQDLASADDELRRLAVERLGLLPAAESIPHLVARLGDESWRVRKAAVERLAASADPAAGRRAARRGARRRREPGPAQRRPRGAGALRQRGAARRSSRPPRAPTRTCASRWSTRSIGIADPSSAGAARRAPLRPGRERARGGRGRAGRDRPRPRPRRPCCAPSRERARAAGAPLGPAGARAHGASGGRGGALRRPRRPAAASRRARACSAGATTRARRSCSSRASPAARARAARRRWRRCCASPADCQPARESSSPRARGRRRSGFPKWSSAPSRASRRRTCRRASPWCSSSASCAASGSCCRCSGRGATRR